MSTRFATALSLSASVAFAAPALAQDALPPLEPGMAVEREEERWIEDGREMRRVEERRYVVDNGHGEHVVADHILPQRFAYTAEERAQWLADCRALYSYDSYGYGRYERRDRDGKIIGGVVGAVAGGIAGNRIADGNRVLGTVVGAGLGGLAGAAIGDAIDGDDDELYLIREEHPGAAGYCEAYLRHYEATGYYAATTVAMTRVERPMQEIRRKVCSDMCEGDVIEEWVDVPARRAIPPRPAPVKTQPVARPRGKVAPLKPIK